MCKLQCRVVSGVVKEVIPELEATGCIVSNGGQVAAEAVQKNGLYELKLERSPVAAAAKSHNPNCIHE